MVVSGSLNDGLDDANIGRVLEDLDVLVFFVYI